MSTSIERRNEPIASGLHQMRDNDDSVPKFINLSLVTTQKSRKSRKTAKGAKFVESNPTSAGFVRQNNAKNETLQN